MTHKQKSRLTRMGRLSENDLSLAASIEEEANPTALRTQYLGRRFSLSPRLAALIAEIAFTVVS